MNIVNDRIIYSIPTDICIAFQDMDIEKRIEIIQRLNLQIVGLTFHKCRGKDEDMLSKKDGYTKEINKMCDGVIQDHRRAVKQIRALKCQVDFLRKQKRPGDIPDASPAKSKSSQVMSVSGSQSPNDEVERSEKLVTSQPTQPLNDSYVDDLGEEVTEEDLSLSFVTEDMRDSQKEVPTKEEPTV